MSFGVQLNSQQLLSLSASVDEELSGTVTHATFTAMLRNRIGEAPSSIPQGTASARISNASDGSGKYVTAYSKHRASYSATTKRGLGAPS